MKERKITHLEAYICEGGDIVITNDPAIPDGKAEDPNHGAVNVQFDQLETLIGWLTELRVEVAEFKRDQAAGPDAEAH